MMARPVVWRALPLFLLFCLVSFSSPKKFEDEEKPAWAKKDIRDYSDADLERLLEQWDVSVSVRDALTRLIAIVILSMVWSSSLR